MVLDPVVAADHNSADDYLGAPLFTILMVRMDSTANGAGRSDESKGIARMACAGRRASATK